MKPGKTKLGIAFPAATMLVMLIIYGRITYALAIMLAAGLHELGHIAAARALGVRLSGLSLDLLGARLETSGRLMSYRDEILLCAAGPAANILSVMLVLPVVLLTRGGFEPAAFFVAASAGLGLLNLIPVASFDGGRILACAISIRSDSLTAFRVTRVLSFLCVMTLWCGSVYLLLRTGASLSLFVFSLSLFCRLFIGV